MKTKTIIIIFACVLAVGFVLGITGTVLSGNEEIPAKDNGTDRLIGVLVVMEDGPDEEYIDEVQFIEEEYYGEELTEEQFEEMLASGSTELEYDDGCLYGKMVDRVDYDDEGNPIHSSEYGFEGIDGVFCYAALIDDGSGMPYHICSSDEGITDAKMHINASEDGEQMNYECTVLVSDAFEGYLCFREVRRTAEGEIYALPGGDSFNGASSTTVTLNDTYTMEINGEKKTESITIAVTAEAVAAPELITVVQMDSDDRLLDSKEYIPGTLPESMEVMADTEYLIVASQTVDYDGNPVVVREVFGRDSDHLLSDRVREDGIIVRSRTELIWQ